MRLFPALVLIFLLLMLPTYSDAGGYKGLQWGSSEEELRNRVTTLERLDKRDPFLMEALLIDRSHLGSVANPDPAIRMDAVNLHDPQENVTYYFQWGSLIAVRVWFPKGGALTEVEGRYGRRSSKKMMYGSQIYEIRAWFRDEGRVVVFERGLRPYVESVTYIDKRYYKAITDALDTQRTASTSGGLNRLD